MMKLKLKWLIPGGVINSRADSNVEIDSLANSIKELGLILPLAVMPEGDDEHYRIIDGNRRYAALCRLFDMEEEVSVEVQDHESVKLAMEQSIAANIEHLPLHPMDQYEAFTRLGNTGLPIADIAAHFGVSERKVRQMMALGALCPTAAALYRANSLDVQLARALCQLVPEEQERLLASGEPHWRILNQIRDAKGESIKSTAPIALFVGLDTYRLEGGSFEADLFVGDEQRDWTDVPLVHRLAEEKIERINASLTSEGWSFFERTSTWIGNDYTQEDGTGEPHELSDKLEQLAKLEAEAEAITEDDEDGQEKYEAIQDRIDALEIGPRAYTPEQKARTGVVLDSNYTLHFGCTPRPVAASKAPKPAAEDGEESVKPISEAIVADLETALTQAVGVALRDSPGHALRLGALMLMKNDTVLALDRDWTLGLSSQGHATCDYNRGVIEEIIRRIWLRRAKSLEAQMGCMWKLDDEAVTEILAFYIAKSLTKRRQNDELVLYMDKLGLLNFSRQWKPTAENFYNRLTKPQLQQLVERNHLKVDGKPVVVDIMKKGEAAELVARLLPEDYVPEEIRPTRKAGKGARARTPKAADLPESGDEQQQGAHYEEPGEEAEEVDVRREAEPTD